MPLKKISFQPGINKEGSQYSAGPGWHDCDRVRFRKGRPEKIGGWTKYLSDPIKGVPRALIDWTTKTLTSYLGVGTHSKFYIETGATYYDVTPIRETTAPGDVTFDAATPLGTGKNYTIVTDVDHGAVIGDWVTFSGAVSLGGNITADVLNHEYEITEVIDSDNYHITTVDANGNDVYQNASDTGNGGAAVVAEYQINTGTNNYVPSTGFGAGEYGSGAWGGSGSVPFSGQLRLYSADIFGDDLLFCPRAGPVYFWDESSGTSVRAVDLTDIGGASNPPEIALQVMVSAMDRHVIAFGSNALGESTIDPLLVRWSTQEDCTDWTPTSTNTSGGQVLSSGSQIIGAIKTRQEILIFTDTSIHSMRYAGAPYVYQFSVVGENISMLGQKAAVSTGDAVYFMDIDGFYVYRGSVEKVPCTVLDYVLNRIDRTQAFKVFAYNNTDNTEVTWFYPSETAQITSDIDSYVTYNYAENVWTIGSLERGVMISANTKEYPVGGSADATDYNLNYLYYHEYGYDDDNSPMNAWIESGEVELTEGDQFVFLTRYIPDFRFSNPNNAAMTISILGTDFPTDDLQVLASNDIDGDTKQVHVRVRARSIALKIEDTGQNYDWTMGDWRFHLRTDGKR